MANQFIRITHKSSGEILAEGKAGWGIFSFEGNYYVANKNLKTKGFSFSGVPGLCPYKFIYFWYHFQSQNGEKHAMLAWKYWIPNPLFPFIAFRIGLPKSHPDILIEKEKLTG